LDQVEHQICCIRVEDVVQGIALPLLLPLLLLVLLVLLLVVLWGEEGRGGDGHLEGPAVQHWQRHQHLQAQPLDGDITE
jgi:hypothetical protein